MPPVTKKRKTGGRDITETPVAAPSLQRGIQSFGRISKAQPKNPLAGKSKAEGNKKLQPAVCISTKVEIPIASKKRKAQHIDEEPETNDDSGNQAALHAVKGNGGAEPRLQPKGISGRGRQPKTPRKKALYKEIPVETPTKGARSYLELLDLSSSPSARQASSPLVSRSDTPASSPPPAERPQDDPHELDPLLPDELQDLINLHSSFLTALSLHYAHHGSLTPVDFRNLRPTIERSWRKRRVSIKDVQQILALQQTPSSTSSKLSLSDYGSSKICIERKTLSENDTAHKRPLSEEHLNEIFLANLVGRWISYTKSEKDAGSPQDFVDSLPLTPIVPCTSAAAIAPLLAKGQRRLEDLKAGASRAQARPQPSTKSTTTYRDTSSSDAENVPPSSKSPTPISLTARKSSLLDRIRAKQAAHLLSAAPLTPSQLQRKSALRRIEEIVPVLELLSASSSAGGVKTFTMPTVVQHLQMSLRNPIEREEAVTVVRLLAEEVSPGWVGVKEVGKIVGVMVRAAGMVGGREEVFRTARELVGRL
ncbi:MAG: hypothetical protein LQ338_000378 [Usnochroma carphineum]|nr:MAG: hypothetical protein LQ338_000378 [Usnochroma carphineum]